ncbi:MAG: hypothetical protein ACREDM_08045 [Methylocella sp.]
MTILAIGSVVLGTVFGRFFKVWVLVPAGALTFAIIFASSAYYENGLLSALLEFAVIAACLQIGYAAGCLSFVITDRWRRPKVPREIPRESSHPAAARRPQLF